MQHIIQWNRYYLWKKQKNQVNSNIQQTYQIERKNQDKKHSSIWRHLGLENYGWKNTQILSWHHGESQFDMSSYST